MSKTEILRMCVACRASKDKRELVRIVKDKDGNISLDLTGKKNGRGAYICKSHECFNKLKKQHSLNRAFKCNVSEEIIDALEKEVQEKA